MVAFGFTMPLAGLSLVVLAIDGTLLGRGTASSSSSSSPPNKDAVGGFPATAFPLLMGIGFAGAANAFFTDGALDLVLPREKESLLGADMVATGEG